MLQQALARGASANVIANDGETPLLNACRNQKGAIVSALLPLTSIETRRSVDTTNGYSALDWLIYFADTNSEPWEQHAIDALLSSRVPVHPENAPLALPYAARLAERRRSQLARRDRSAAMQWRAHEDLFGLAQDFQELRHAEARVEERERRVRDLEEALRRRGESVDEDEEEAEEEDKGAAAAAASK